MPTVSCSTPTYSTYTIHTGYRRTHTSKMLANLYYYIQARFRDYCFSPLDMFFFTSMYIMPKRTETIETRVSVFCLKHFFILFTYNKNSFSNRSVSSCHCCAKHKYGGAHCFFVMLARISGGNKWHMSRNATTIWLNCRNIV